MVNGGTRVIEKLNQPLNQYLIQCEFGKTRDSLLYFDPINEFWEYIRSTGMKYAFKDTQRALHFQIPKTNSKKEESVLLAQVYKCFAHAFGYDITSYFELYNSLFEKYPENFERTEK